MQRLSITSKGTLDPTLIAGDLNHLLTKLNEAAALNHQWALFDLPDGQNVLLSIPNITRVLPLGDKDAYIGG